MLASISIKTRLGALVVLSAGLLATVAGTGLAGMFALDRNIADLIDRQIRPAQQLATIQDLMRADVELLLRISQLDPRLNEGRSVAADVLEGYTDEMASNGDFVELLWARYAERVAGDTERRLASDFLEARKALLEQGQAPVLSHFRSGAFADGNTALSRQLLPRFESAADALNALMLYKTETADRTYASVQARLQRDILAMLIVVAGGLLLAGLLGAMVTRAIVRPAKRAIEVFAAIGNDQLDSAIEVNSNDEMGRILAGLNEMQTRLRSRLLTEREEAARARRISDALDAVSDAILVTDTDRRIIHLNPAARMLFERHQATFREFLPEFDPDRLPGADMALFQRLPGGRESLADEPAACRQARLQLGEVSLAVTVTPIHDDAGGRLGAVVQWLDESAEVAAEQALEGLVRAATRGDFSRRMEVAAGSGFFRRLGEQLNLLIGTTDASLREVSRVLSALAEGDLTERVTGDFAGAFGDLQDATNHSIEQLETLIGQVHEAVDAIASAARQISAGHANLSHRTEEQAASLEETASSMEQMTSTVRQNATHAGQANKLAQGACQVADQGGLKVREVVSSMSRIADSARRIENIVAVIDGIAFQTNILALNAAVEAARAGEQGRGFAVVAGEVRTLAQRSAEAAREIKALIAASVESVASGNTLAGQAGQTMDDIVSAIKGVTDIMSEISAASAEQSQGIDQVSVTVSQLDEMTQQNAALVEEATAAAGMLQEQAERLTAAVSAFHSSRRSPTGPPAPNEHLPGLPPRIAQRGQAPTASTRPGAPSPVNRYRLDRDPVDEQEWVEF